VDQRLNELLAQLSVSRPDTTRSQLLAALVSMAPVEPSELAGIIREYVSKRAGGIVLQRTGPITMVRRQPGRRPR
jgi:hypothetical protein